MKKKQKMQKIMNLTNKTKTSVDLNLYGDIGEHFFDEVSSSKIVEDLKSLDVEVINLYISSNGGGVMAAISIANALKRHKAKVVAHIDGIVASAATIITSACDVVKMPKNTLFMIHNPWTIAMGEEKDFEKMAEVLSKIKNSILETYVDKTGLEKEVLSEYMDKESWLSATEAKELGFVDEIIDAQKEEKEEEEMQEKEEKEEKQDINSMIANIKNQIIIELRNEIMKEVREDYRNESHPISNIGFVGDTSTKEEKIEGSLLGVKISDLIKFEEVK